MLEQQNTDDVLNLENIEERKENAINILEKARIYHEKYGQIISPAFGAVDAFDIL